LLIPPLAFSIIGQQDQGISNLVATLT
jgi:hypothetical protein